jgi:hypothetical protein
MGPEMPASALTMMTHSYFVGVWLTAPKAILALALKMKGNLQKKFRPP